MLVLLSRRIFLQSFAYLITFESIHTINSAQSSAGFIVYIHALFVEIIVSRLVT